MQLVLDSLASAGNLEWLDKGRTRAHVYWRTPEQWGALIYGWARENGMTGGAVCTFFELTQGDDAADQPFAGLEQDVLVKALKALELDKRAEVFEGDEGVKFF